MNRTASLDVACPTGGHGPRAVESTCSTTPVDRRADDLDPPDIGRRGQESTAARVGMLAPNPCSHREFRRCF